MSEIRGTVKMDVLEAPEIDDDEDFTGYMGYGDGAILTLLEREGAETILSRKRYDSVFENLEEALGKWLNYVFGSEEDGHRESEG